MFVRHRMELRRSLVAEFVGTLGLCCANVGAGIMAEKKLHDEGLVLLAVSLSTGVALAALIATLTTVSKAYFNPMVTLADLVERKCGARDAVAFVVAQVLGALCGVWVAHAMFGLDLLQVSTQARPGFTQFLGETAATAGLLTVIGGTTKKPIAPFAVGGFIFAAHWFTSSTSLANPALTIARGFTATYAGVRPLDLPLFLGGQLAGGVVALALRRLLGFDRIEDARVQD